MIYSFKPTRNLHPLALSQIGTLGVPEENRWSALDGSHSNAEVRLVLESRAQTIGRMPPAGEEPLSLLCGSGTSATKCRVKFLPPPKDRRGMPYSSISLTRLASFSGSTSSPSRSKGPRHYLAAYQRRANVRNGSKADISGNGSGGQLEILALSNQVPTAQLQNHKIIRAREASPGEGPPACREVQLTRCTIIWRCTSAAGRRRSRAPFRFASAPEQSPQ
jgi:hypothetical protein